MLFFGNNFLGHVRRSRGLTSVVFPPNERVKRLRQILKVRLRQNVRYDAIRYDRHMEMHMKIFIHHLKMIDNIQ